MELLDITKPSGFSTYTRESNAKIVFSKIPTFEFLTQRFVLPGISAGTVLMHGRTGSFSRPGEMLEFEKPWNLEIILDEKYIAYKEVYDWMMLYMNTEGDVTRDMKLFTTDARIVILDNEGKGIGAVNFMDVYPIGLGPIQYATTDSGVTYMKFNASFDYSIFKLDFGYTSICDVQ